MLLAAAACAGGIVIFHACEKGTEPAVPDKNLNLEAQFIVRNGDETCTQVTLFRDEQGNAEFVTQQTPEDSAAKTALLFPLKLEAKLLQDKGEGGSITVPNDGIYWLISFDGYDPVKFEPDPMGDTKTVPNPREVDISCDCNEGIPDHALPSGSACDKAYSSSIGGFFCTPKSGSHCSKCLTHVRVSYKASTIYIPGSTYLLQSDTITINGITYE